MKFVVCLLLACASFSGFAQVSAPRTCGLPGVAFINGIQNDETLDAEVSRKTLSIALKHRLSQAKNVPVALAYNKTFGGVADVIESLYQKGLTYNQRTEDVARNIYGGLHGHDELLRDAPPGYWEEIRFALHAFFNAVTQDFVRGKVEYDKTLKSTTETYQQVLAENPGLYVVAHSQGSLFANDSFYMMDVTDLSGPKRSYSGGYFVAPAAASMYSPFVRGYTKAYTDLLATLNIGLSANVNLFDSETEKELYGGLGDTKMHHGFATSYLNPDLAGMSDGQVKSPPHFRMYNRVIDAIAADLETLKKPCEEAWKLPVSTYEMFVFTDVLLYRDAFFCALYTADIGAPLPSDRSTCMTQYSPQVETLHGRDGSPLPLDWNGVCQHYEGALYCTLALHPSPTETLSYHIAAIPAPEGATCGAGQFEVRTVATDARRCLDWTQALALIRTIP